MDSNPVRSDDGFKEDCKYISLDGISSSGQEEPLPPSLQVLGLLEPAPPLGFGHVDQSARHLQHSPGPRGLHLA